MDDFHRGCERQICLLPLEASCYQHAVSETVQWSKASHAAANIQSAVGSLQFCRMPEVPQSQGEDSDEGTEQQNERMKP